MNPSIPTSYIAGATKAVIGGGSVESTSICLDDEICDDELAGRYSSLTRDMDDDDSIVLFRPEDCEVIARYAVKADQESDDEIILNHPNDDDIVRRYGGSVCKGDSPSRSTANKGRLDDATPAPHSTVLTDFNENVPCVKEKCPSATNGDPEEDVEYISDSASSDVEIVERSSNRSLDDESDVSTTEDFQGSCYDSVDAADDAFRALMKPGGSSPQNRNITFFNVCCNKETVSSISIDALERSSDLTRGDCSPGLRQMKLSSLKGSSRCSKERHHLKKSRSRSELERCVRSDHLFNVIHTIENLSQNVESHCIEARRSLRRNLSPGNIFKTENKLRTAITPLLNRQYVLLGKIRHLP